MYDEVINKICNIEHAVDTSLLTYGGINYWPVCRLRLWVHLIGMKINSDDHTADLRVPNIGPVFDDSGTANAFPVGNPDLGLLHTDRAAANALESTGGFSPDIIFFLRPEEYRDQVEERAFAKILDSVYERARDYKCLKLELANSRAMQINRRFPSVFVHPETMARRTRFDPQYDLVNFSSVLPMIDDLCGVSSITPESMLNDMDKIFYFARMFEVILLDLSPRSIFLSVYYHPTGLALMLAAHRLNIPTIDVQHGRLGPYHGLYTQMTAAPTNGYALLPDYIWCWGNKTKQDIEVDKNPECTRHGGIVGGNPWLDRWKTKHSKETLSEETRSLEARSEGQKKILVSLQPLEVPLPALVIEAMEASPSNWIWWIRVHPLRHNTVPEISKILSDKGVKNFEVRMATESPLFVLLKNCDHHVTAFSSVAIEALAFGKTTTLFSAISDQIFEDYVNRGLFSVATEPNDLIEQVAAALDGTMIRDDNPFINTSEGLAEKVFAHIMRESSDAPKSEGN